MALLADVINIDSQSGFDYMQMAMSLAGLALMAAGIAIAMPSVRGYIARWPWLSAILREPVRLLPLTLTLVLIGGFFVLYQLSFALHETVWKYGWFFGADNVSTTVYRVGAWEGWEARRHPLFVLLVPALYRIARAAFGIVLDGGLGLNFATIFPTALLGALNIWLSFKILLRNHSDLWLALVFTALYGLSAATWIFSSFPSTYTFTALVTNLFILALFTHRNDFSRPNIVTAGTNVLAGFTAPQQVFLAILPGLAYLRSGRWSRKTFRNAVVYGLILVVFLVVPYAIYLSFNEGSERVVDGTIAYFGIENLFDLRWYVMVMLNFLFFSVIGPIIHPDLYTDPSMSALAQFSIPWIALAGLYSVISVRGLWGLRGSPAKLASMAPNILVFLALYILAFIFFNPGEAFLYPLPVLLPWLLIIHSGLVRGVSRAWRIALLLLVLGVAANNFMLILYLNGLKATLDSLG